MELSAIEKGLIKKEVCTRASYWSIAGTRSLIQSLTRETEAIGDDSTAKPVSEQQRIVQENDDLRAAAEIAQHQLEALQEEIEHIRDEANKRLSLRFFKR